MTHFHVTRRMAYPPEALHAIAADVARYCEFLPLCTASRVSGRQTDEQGRERFRGELTISYPKLGLSETLSSDVTVDRARLMVRALSNEGPVKALENRWVFRPDGQGGSEVEFSVEFTMASRILQGIVSGLFDYALRKVMTAFEARAAELCGKSP